MNHCPSSGRSEEEGSSQRKGAVEHLAWANEKERVGWAPASIALHFLTVDGSPQLLPPGLLHRKGLCPQTASQGNTFSAPRMHSITIGKLTHATNNPHNLVNRPVRLVPQAQQW